MTVMRRWLALSGVTIAIVLVTFPWDLQDHTHWMKVAWVPFLTGVVRPLDAAGNFALYLPFGLLMPGRTRRRRVVAAVAAAFLLSGLTELGQIWSHVRFPSATDLVMNVLGSAAGGVIRSRRVAVERPIASGPDALSA